jgi:glycosyltransferase involved in cell wall biosynthesis
MTWRTEGARAARGVTKREPQAGAPLTVVMATRRGPAHMGGVERVVAGLLTELARTRPSWQVRPVYVFHPGSRVEGIDGLSDVVASLRLGWLLRRSPADVVFVHCPECLWGIRLLRRRRGAAPLVAVWHGAGPTPYLLLRRPGDPMARVLAWIRTAGEKTALAADGHVAVHRGVADALRSVYGLRRPVTVIENALDPAISELRPAPASEHESEHEHESERGLTAVWVGQTGYRKGLDVALAAVAQARRDVPGLRLTVVGVPAGQQADGVDWLGVIPPARMAEVYRDADLLLFPTRYESFGLVVIEAMAAGLPVIVSDAVPPGIVIDGRNGAVIAGHDPARYAAALRRLADPGTRAAMAEANRDDVRRFSIESAGAGYVALAESFAAIH